MNTIVKLLDEWRSREYRYGIADCALLAGEVAYAKTGRPEIRALLDRLAGRYDNHDDGMALLRAELDTLGYAPAHGDEHPLESVCRHFFGEPVAPLQARRYDVVLGDWGAGVSLGVCDGHRIIGVADRGLARVPLSRATMAWHV